MNTSQTTWASLASMVKMLKPAPDPGPIWCHPANADHLRQRFREHFWPECPPTLFSGHGVDIHTSPHLPRWHKRWEFPATPFVEYEKSDERWAVPLGFGRWVDDTSRPAFFRFPEPSRAAPIRFYPEPPAPALACPQYHARIPRLPVLLHQA